MSINYTTRTTEADVIAEMNFTFRVAHDMIGYK